VANSDALAYSQGTLTKDKNYGRDQSSALFHYLDGGGGVKPGLTYGRTDDYCYNIAERKWQPAATDKSQFMPGAVHVHDLQRPSYTCWALIRDALTYLYQGRRFRLTDVEGHVSGDFKLRQPQNKKVKPVKLKTRNKRKGKFKIQQATARLRSSPLT